MQQIRQVKLPRANPDVLFKPVSDGAVLLHVADEVYFGLNAVGAKVWENLPPASRTLEELCEKIQSEYPEATVEQIREDVEELLEELIQFKLVVPASANGAGPDHVASPSA